MTSLFVRFYVGVLVVLVAAWYIHGVASQANQRAERLRVIEGAHGGGARMVVDQLNAVSAEARPERIEKLQARFDFPIRLMKRDEIPDSVRTRLQSGDDVVYRDDPEAGGLIYAAVRGGQVVRLGGLPGPSYRYITLALGGGLRLATAKLEAASGPNRDRALDELRTRFNYPVTITERTNLPGDAAARLDDENDLILFSENDRGFIAAPLANQEAALFGPLPNFQPTEQRTIGTTLAIVLLLAAVAIALLLRPVAGQLRRVEHAAKAIASGNLETRVDERQVGSAKALARAFNEMVDRTQSLVRTQRELLQAISHELRTPLARMRFAIGLLEDADDEQERQRRLESLDKGAAELNDLVNELLTYVRVETSRPTEPEPVSVQSVIDAVMPEYALFYPSIEYKFVDAPDAPAVVEADTHGLQRVINNLLSNAGKYAQSQVHVRVANGEGQVTLDIDDDGPGIPEHDRGRVFEPFVRLDENGEGHGVGLGLALVKRIMLQHGGSAEILSSPLGGCRVRTIWPSSDRSARR